MKNIFLTLSLLMVANIFTGDWIGAPDLQHWSVLGLIQGLRLGTMQEIKRRARMQELTDEDIAMICSAGIVLSADTKPNKTTELTDTKPNKTTELTR